MYDETEALDQSALSGTAHLARAALSSPAPHAEMASKAQVETLMQDAALAPRILREAMAAQPRSPWWQPFLFWRK